MNSICSRNLPAVAALAVLFSSVLSIGSLAALPAGADEWAAYQHDNAHTGRSSVSFDPTQLKKAWTSPNLYANSIVADDSIFGRRFRDAGTTAMTSFNLKTGQQNWSIVFPDLNRRFFDLSEPNYAEGRLYFVGGHSTFPYRLYALDAATGVGQYSVELPPAVDSALTPTIERNANNELVAYVHDADRLMAINLGETSGALRWSGLGSHIHAMPTVVGESIIVARGGRYLAFDQLTGASNQFFFISGGSGGSGTAPAYDSSRKQFYVQDTSHDVLTAFAYTNNSTITQLWQVPGRQNLGGSVAIGEDGRIYKTESGGNLLELDPADGHVLRSTSGLHLANGITPALSGNSIFLDNEGTTEIVDLATFKVVKSLSGSRGSSNTELDSPGAIFDSGFVHFYAHHNAFDVYFVVPEPSAAVPMAAAAIWAWAVRGWRTARCHN